MCIRICVVSWWAATTSPGSRRARRTPSCTCCCRPPGRSELTIDQTFTWEKFEQMPDADRPVGAYYTVRQWDPERRELTMLMVRHGDSGQASAWVDGAVPGDPVALWGPRTAYHPPAATDWHLLVGDDTGLPAVAVILESLPAGAVAKVFAEVADARNIRTCRCRRVRRHVAAPRRCAGRVDDTARRCGPLDALARRHAVRVGWRREQGDDRRAPYVRGEIGLHREAVSLVAYWRHAG